MVLLGAATITGCIMKLYDHLIDLHFVRYRLAHTIVDMTIHLFHVYRAKGIVIGSELILTCCLVHMTKSELCCYADNKLVV